MKRDTYDVVIIGGGPAGSAAAIRLALSGRKVLIAEKTKFPRNKLCGEFVSPECVAHFDELGIMPKVERLRIPKLTRTVFYNRRGTPLTISNSWLDANGSSSIGLSRAAMDDLLLQRAVNIGVDVRTQTSLFKPTIQNGRISSVELRDHTGEMIFVDTTLTIDATGRSRALARFFDTTKPRKAGLVAFKSHVRNAHIEKSSCEIFSYPGGYGGCTEIENGLYNLCFIADAAIVRSIGNDPEAVLHRVVMENSRAREVLSEVEMIGDWIAVPIARFGRETLVPSEGVLSIGDAAAFIDPFTGSGIALALESAKIATTAITINTVFADIAAAYQRSYSSAFDSRLRFCKFLRLVSAAPVLAEAVIALLSKSSYLSKLFAAGTRSSHAVKADL
jgi:menaquinone-9 beta-reductase